MAGLLGFGALSGLNVLRYAQESLITPSIDGLTALPLGEGVRMASALLSAEQIGDSVVFADVDAWILNSFSGRLFEVDRDADATKTLYLPERGGVYLIFSPTDQPEPFRSPESHSGAMSSPMAARLRRFESRRTWRSRQLTSRAIKG